MSRSQRFRRIIGRVRGSLLAATLSGTTGVAKIPGGCFAVASGGCDREGGQVGKSGKRSGRPVERPEAPDKRSEPEGDPVGQPVATYGSVFWAGAALLLVTLITVFLFRGVLRAEPASHAPVSSSANLLAVAQGDVIF